MLHAHGYVPLWPFNHMHCTRRYTPQRSLARTRYDMTCSELVCVMTHAIRHRVDLAVSVSLCTRLVRSDTRSVACTR